MCAAEKGEKRKAEGIEDNPITFAKQILHPSLMDFITLVISSDLSDFIVWSICDTPLPPNKQHKEEITNDAQTV